MSSSALLLPKLPAKQVYRLPSQRHGAARRATPRVRVSALGPAARLATYSAAGSPRDVLAVERPDESMLVLDCPAGRLSDARLVGHIRPEEPTGNAQLLAAMYVSDPGRGRPRLLSREDLTLASGANGGSDACSEPGFDLLGRGGERYALRPNPVSVGLDELRWMRLTAAGSRSPTAVTLRVVLGALEDYEPARTITRAALEPTVPGLSVSKLRCELQRIEGSAIVLNRGLREAVLRRTADGTSMSEIAMRCERFKKDRNGNRSGETSWLARRIGVMPEGGESAPTPWIHSDTLALIARDGLDLSPNEVEL